MANELDYVYKRGQGYVWIQPNGPGTPYLYLNCAGLEGVQKNEGNVAPLYCKDEAQAGRFRVRDTVQGEPSPVTTSLQIPLGRAANYLFGLKCAFNLQVRFTTCERPDDPTNYEKIIHLENVKITQRQTDALSARKPGDDSEVLQTLQLSAADMFEVNAVTVQRQNIAETEALTDVIFDDAQACESNCGPARSACTNGYITSNAAVYAAKAQVWKTTNGGGTWTATTADPGAVSENLSSVVMNGSRVIVSRGSTDAGNPAEVWYSDDGGVTWTSVNVGSTNGQTIQRMFWLARPYLWAVLSAGYIAFSSDAGLSWTVQDAGAATTQSLNDVDFVNSRVGAAVGASNAFVVTNDGGISWAAVTGPVPGVVLNAVDVVDEATYFVAAANGNLYKTGDKGVTWTTLTFSGAGVGNVKDIEFYNQSFGFMLFNPTAGGGKVFRTVDGGKTWTSQGAVTNNGLNKVHVCDQNNAFAVGAFQSTSGVVLSVSD